ncbi:hypothetical protein [Rhodococcus rhodochrous]|uniref:hypothetical protein n=1 Tax=Rhodococcus rhodochrous TaxID=1829 RepID=UPI00177C7B87|nr:hypothetical protein [Rhodococcus rhodochrous]
MKKISLKSLTRRTKLFVATGIVLAGTSSVLAFNNFDNSAADIMSPTEVKVNDHEDRITKAEADITETKGRVEQVEQKTEENTQAIAQTNERVTVVERQVETVREQVPAPSPAPTPAPQPAQAPAPIPQLNPRKVVAVAAEEQINRYGEHSGWTCRYTLEGGQVIVNVQPDACYVVGHVISAEMASLHRVR